MKSKELLLKHLALNDCKGYVTSDGRLYKAIINALEEAINYTHCCTELRDKETPKIEDWLKNNFKRLDRHSFTNTYEDTIWLRSELVEVYNQLHP